MKGTSAVLIPFDSTDAVELKALIDGAKMPTLCNSPICYLDSDVNERKELKDRLTTPPDKNGTLYIFGHGDPGVPKLSAGAGGKTVEPCDILKFLRDEINLPQTFAGKIKALGCNTGAPIGGMSFAGELHSLLRVHGFSKCVVVGYVGKLWAPSECPDGHKMFLTDTKHKRGKEVQVFWPAEKKDSAPGKCHIL
jgi:hypothetical protein